MRKDNLGFLMKSYESSFATRLLKKSPAIIYPMKYRRGIACYKTEIDVYSDYVHSNIARRVWYVDENIPVFSEEPEYIERHFIFKD